ncbi:MAG: acetyl ornithine aminotransferase family protein [Polyangiaceae bacterium]|nr:acetyl ornithine aminotransferase family protein [Polyangiaceae bacterium]
MAPSVKTAKGPALTDETLQSSRESIAYPRILVPPPGPNAQRIIAIDQEYASPSYIKEYPLVIGGGQGAMVEDVDGNRYIDFMSGIAVSSTGYNHPVVVKAIQEQAGKFLHICGTDFYYDTMARLMEKLALLAPGSDKKRVFLTNSGTEATEGAIKLARRATGRQNIVAFEGGFHGRTYAGITLSASKVKYRHGFGPLLPGFYHVPYDYPYRSPQDLGSIKHLFESRVAADEVAAIFIEPILGEGGYVVPRPEFISGLRRICDENGILLIFDEVQSGVGRTGHMWAANYFGIEPDILLTAKGLGSGMPIGAIIARESVMKWTRGSHGSTFGGNPVCCAAALATLDLVSNGLMDNAAKMGHRLISGLKHLQSKHRQIGDVRGVGLMVGMELVTDPKTKEPAGNLMGELEQLAFRRGLLLLGCGKSVIRIAPPLVVSPYDVDKGIEIIDECLTELLR